MYIRLQKFLAECGLGSRRSCERLIEKGLISVNGQIEKILGSKIDPDKDEVSYLDKKLYVQKKLYLALNKPSGYICTAQDTHQRDRVLDLLPSFKERLYTVGRLDLRSQGLLLITNDGAFAQAITGPQTHVAKTYRVKTARALSKDEIGLLQKKMVIDGISYRPVKLIDQQKTQLNQFWITLELIEGKKREIRHIFEFLNLPLITLERIAIGPIKLGALKKGQYRPLTSKEINIFLSKK